jgi:hypothetical protein
VRLSRNTFDAAFATDFEVVFLGDFLCESALPAALLDFLPVDLLRNVLEAAEAALRLVTLPFLGIRIFHLK